MKLTDEEKKAEIRQLIRSMTTVFESDEMSPQQQAIRRDLAKWPTICPDPRKLREESEKKEKKI